MQLYSGVTRRPARTRRLNALTLAPLLLLAVWTPTATVHAQAARADANQLHAAITNGDVEALRYWLTVRHADASGPNAEEPDVTPLERCLRMAARILAPPGARERAAREAGLPVVRLRALQDMVTLLHDHGARLADADRQNFSGPVLRWYDDAVSPSTEATSATKPGAAAHAPPPSSAPASPPSQPAAAPAAPNAADTPSVGVLTLDTHPVFVTTDAHKECNGTGHVVYLVNRSQLSVRATVTTSVEGPSGANPTQTRGSYAVDPTSIWRLGCDTSSDGRRVSYVLNEWR